MDAAGGLFDSPDALPLRDYQGGNATEMLAYVQRGMHPLLHAPTGSGKTVTAAHVVKELSRAGKRCLFLAHRREIIRQTSRTFDAVGVPHGLIIPQHDVSDELVHIGSIDTVGARLQRMAGWMRSVDVAIFDEAHHAVAAGWQRVRRALDGANCIGLTATPYRLDGRGLGGHFTAVVRAPSIRQLIATGWLAPPAVYAPIGKIDLSRVTRRAGDYAQGELERILDTDSVAMAAVRQYGRYLPGKTCIVFCVTVEHAKHVAEAFCKAGWAAECLHGGLSEVERDGMVARLGDGRTQVLVTVEVVSEGFDLPAVAGAILIRTTLSTAKFLQQIGRALRPVYIPGFGNPLDHTAEQRVAAIAAGEKPSAIIIDLVRNTLVHGMPEADRPWTLAGGCAGLERSVPKTARCPKCFRVHEVAPACIGCGYVYRRKAQAMPAVVEPLLPAGVRGVPVETILQMPMQALKKLGRTKQELELIASIRGFKPGWVWYVMNERSNGPRRGW